MKRQMAGVSLIEVILALVVGMSILFLSVRQYRSFRLDADAQQLQYNVDVIFQAMADYYQVNCYGTTAPTTGIVTAGKLNPSVSSGNSVVIIIQSDLAAPGFLNTPLSPNSLVDTTGPVTNPYNGYVAQFNKSTQVVNACTTTNCAASAPIGTSVMWRAQVAVLLKDTTTAQQYKNILTADCLSNIGAGGIVTPCTAAASSSGSYVVFERLPSLASPNSNSQLWVSNPILKEFNQMYTTYPVVYLLETQGTITAQPSNPQQYFLCGS